MIPRQVAMSLHDPWSCELLSHYASGIAWGEVIFDHNVRGTMGGAHTKSQELPAGYPDRIANIAHQSSFLMTNRFSASHQPVQRDTRSTGWASRMKKYGVLTPKSLAGGGQKVRN